MPSLTIVLLVAGAGLLYIIYARARAGRRGAGRPTPREHIARARSTIAAEEELSARMAEMLELAGRLTAQLDTKARYLQHLIEAAEQAANRIEAGPYRPARPQHPELAARWFEPSFELADQALGTECDLMKPRPSAQLRDEIIRLAEEGCSAIEIAQRLDEATGKVELILALHRQRRQKDPTPLGHPM